jgi:hypothetical protein
MTKTFSPSEAALSVFELAKRQPQFVLRYCIIYALILMATYVIAGATGVGEAFQNYVALSGTGRPPSPQKMMDVLSPAGPGFGVIIAFGLISGAVTSAMALRKAVRNEDSGLFGLQFGADEFRLLGAMALIGLIVFGINMAISVIGGFVLAGNAALAVLLVFVALLVACFFMLRLSQFGVLTIANQAVTVIPSWAETNGQVWRFLGAYLLWIIIASILGLIAQSLGGIGALAMGVKVSGGLPSSAVDAFKPGWLFYSLIYGLASGFGNLGSICIGAYAWHQMRGDLPAAYPNT